jgi:DNA-directed RNA polymerase specialized sigma24 family protein
LLDSEAAGNDQDAPLERELDGRCVRAAFRSLQPRYKELLYLRDIVGVDYEELVTLIGGTQGSVRAGVFRARRALRGRFGALGEGCK